MRENESMRIDSTSTSSPSAQDHCLAIEQRAHVFDQLGLPAPRRPITMSAHTVLAQRSDRELTNVMCGSMVRQVSFFAPAVVPHAGSSESSAG